MTTSSRRKEQRYKRTQERKRKQRRNIIASVGAVVLVLVILLALSALTRDNTPVGEVIPITPHPVPQANGTAAGDPNAKVKIDAYEDFQCPACRYYTENTEPQVMEQLVATGKVYYVFHQYPFIDDNSVTKESDHAANASLCAADQGRFWDYQDILYANWKGENQGSFADKRLIAFAQTLGLDMTKFESCFNSKQHQAEIDQDILNGKKMGVSGTPSIFVDGTLLTPGKIPTFEDIQAAVNAALGQ